MTILSSSEAINQIRHLNVGEPRSRRPASSRRMILDVTRRMLRDGGYHELSMIAVAEEANVARRTLYNQFFSKDELYRCSREELIFGLAGMVPQEVPSRLAPLDAFLYIGRHTYEVLADPRNREFVRSIIRDGATHPWLAQLHHRHIRGTLERTCEVLILQTSRGKPLPLAWPQAIASQFISIIDAIAGGQDKDPSNHWELAPIDGQLEIVSKAYALLIENAEPITT